MAKIKWGIIGTGNIDNNVKDGIKSSYDGQLVGRASKNDDRRISFGCKYSGHEYLR